MQGHREISRVKRYSWYPYSHRNLYGDILERLYANLGPKTEEAFQLGHRPWDLGVDNLWNCSRLYSSSGDGYDSGWNSAV
jgi:hypothetical protein